MSLRNVYDQTRVRLEAVCHQHAVALLAELRQQPHVQLVDHLQAPMPNDDWRWRWCRQVEGWNVPRTTVWLSYSTQLSFTYKHNWLVMAHPNVSGRSLQFGACLVDDQLRNAQRNTIVLGSVYGFDALWKRIEKHKNKVPLNFQFWEINKNAQDKNQPR